MTENVKQIKKILTYEKNSASNLIISIHDIVIPALLGNKYVTLDDKNNKLNNLHHRDIIQHMAP